MEYELTGQTPILNKVAEKLKKLSFTTDILGDTKQQSIKKSSIKSYEDILDRVSAHF